MGLLVARGDNFIRHIRRLRSAAPRPTVDAIADHGLRRTGVATIHRATRVSIWLFAHAFLLAVLPNVLNAADLPNRDLTLPDPKLTPGLAVDIGLHELCTKKWGRDKRFVTAAMKRKVFKDYGLRGNFPVSWCHRDKHKRVFEIDHLISRELGGADDTADLWPQCYSGVWSAVMKDRVENRLHKEICLGHITLKDAQIEIVADWRIPYRRYFGQRK